MASIREIRPVKQVLETMIEGLYVRNLSYAEMQVLQKEFEELQFSDDEIPVFKKILSIACDESGEAFVEFETEEEIAKLTMDEIREFCRVIFDAISPGSDSEKK